MNLTTENFIDLFELTDISSRCQNLVDTYDFSYEPTTGDQRDEIILTILSALYRGFDKTGNVSKWNEGWEENFQAYLKSGKNPEFLMPRYYKRTPSPLRLQKNFILPNDGNFETSFFDVLRMWVAEEYISTSDHVYEFGCGPAHNLLAFNEIFPNKQYTGLDWAIPSQKIIKAIDKPNISGDYFDMLCPNNLQLKPGSLVLTIGALEQLGSKFDTIMEYWMKQPVSMFVHLEPIIEFYDPSNLLDYLAIKYTQDRNYLQGYMTLLQKMNDEGTIEITKKTRVPFGGLFNEGWNIISWRKNEC
jgi:hypothetical protein